MTKSALHGILQWVVLRNGIFYPQRAEGTHRAEGNIAFAKGKNITSSLFKVSRKGTL